MRKRRRNLSSSQQRIAALGASRELAKLPVFKLASNIALYFANDGELSPHLIAQLARMKKKRLFYPVLQRKTLLFRDFPRYAGLGLNRYGIAEPLPRYKALAAQQLDIIIVPLVAFDRSGNRLGMGGGYYDRSLAFKARTPFNKPLLIGLAHSVQETPVLSVDNWDIGLDYLVTEKEVINCKKRLC
ncbi:5-formyltetrahydrofolate cyclo-ligase [Alteromonadaceae bacterium Bs31]|nr:5-formyltetrahydrofolate cyclo-ligase [Alteromonadaceae bacterium Bs31]